MSETTARRTSRTCVPMASRNLPQCRISRCGTGGVELHIRRRRWLTPDGRSVILNIYPLVAEGTQHSVAFAEFLKKNLDTTPVTARCLGKYYFTDGDNLERCYEDSLSGFREWGQREHAKDWVLQPDNMGERLSIDESSL